MFTPAVAVGDVVHGGDVLGAVEERPGFLHQVLVPPAIAEQRITRISAGAFSVADTVAELADGTPLRLAHDWPVRRPRPVA
jgi:V/A-type H+-transporting ATPase subunit A